MIKLVTFDLDDTLWDVRPALKKAEDAQNVWLRNHYPTIGPLIEPQIARERKAQLLKTQPDLIHNISRFRQQFLEQLLLDLGIPVLEAQQSAMSAFEIFLSQRNAVAVFEHAEPTLKVLSRRYQLAALTNGNADVFKTPLSAYFAFALKAEDVGAAKPDPLIFHTALAQADTSAEYCVHVGDSHDHDIAGAARAGVASIWLTERDHRSDTATATIHCLSELPDVIDSL